jgi:sulfide-dependent adenosine diphosphate thiazole synthase
MTIDDLTISKAIINSYMKKLLGSLQLDVALVGAGPSNLVAGYYLAKQGLKAAIFESKLAPGGGIWGGGMMFNEIIVPDDALAIVEEAGIRFQPVGDGYYTMDSVEMAATLISNCVQSGTVIFNLIKATDVLFREENGQPRVSGLVVNWSPVESLDLHIDPLGIKASFVVDGTGHPAEICRIVIRKMGVKLNTRTGDVVGEMPLWAERGEQFTVSNTGEVFPGLYVAGMASNNVFGGPRMGPIFGGMLLSGKKIAELIFREANGGS